MKKPVYLDYNSTTPVDERVLEFMLPFFSDKFGNAASKTHAYGWVTEEAVQTAREQVAALIHSEPGEIIFTSGATESINLALKGVYEKYHSKGNHIITVATEHKAVLDTCVHLEKYGAQITYLPVDKGGLIDTGRLRSCMTDQTILVCVMMANNETGVIQPMREISQIVHERNSLLMSDATQACGKIPVDVRHEGIDLLCVSAHKFYGPKGAGALYVSRKNPRVSLVPLIDGGGHEKGLRSGTLNVPAIAGFGKGCEIADTEMAENAKRIKVMRDHLETEILQAGNVFVNGSRENRLFNVTNLAFSGVHANALIGELKDIAVATGSACSSAIPQPSHVLKAMNIPDDLAYSAIRFSLGKYTTEEEIRFVAGRVKEVVCRLRISE
ncbi:MAG: aminotransferase class V-fold PLP-dependent enzyme [Bacteroidetes bacterium]|nr:aminotransferase class V-fold PLP-dependent enzyme [Bacteroidota bacterium]